MEPQQLKGAAEALLFVAGKPLTAKELAKILDSDEAAVQDALARLQQERREAGVVLLENRGQYQLATASHFSTQVKNFLNAELREKLTDATVEVLAIIAYRQPISKAEIEAIRGVNSQYSLRHLLMRGLIERIANPRDARSFLYQTTTEFLMHLGLQSNSELPEFDRLVESIKLPQTPALSGEAAGAPEDPAAPAVGEEAKTAEPIAPEQDKNAAPEPQIQDAGGGEEYEEDDEFDEEGEEDGGA
ncbi:MAG TPA: SMC-Scp complex subunit ScpB [Patescibacteria group bacterium]|nr:SMC-Scp complex subunit ScpB [Patescibacteria group bacterium]